MPLTASWVVLLAGLAFILVSVNADLYKQLHVHVHSRLHRLSGVAPITLSLTSSLTKTALVVIGLLLLMLSHGLRRRKHRSWQAVMTLLIVAAVVNLIRLLHHVTTNIGITTVLIGFGITAILVGFGWYYRAEFYAVGDPRTRWRALGAFIALLAADIAIGLAFIAMRGLVTNYTIPERFQAVLYGLVGASPPVPIHFAQDIRGDFFGILTITLGVLTLVVTAYLFLRPAEPMQRLGASDAAGVRLLLDRHGDSDSLGYFALRDDKSIIWSPTQKSCIGYRVVSGVMLASGDPLGDPEAWPGAIHAFLDEASRHAWVPAVVGCSELGAEVWCRSGDLTALELGDEAIVQAAGFSLQGRQMRNVRQMVTRVARAGYAAEVRRVGDVPAEELTRLTRQADSWRGNPTERGFSMALGRIGGAGDDRCVIVTATQDGVLRALLQFVPWGADGLSLDLMRRDRSAQPGLNDFLIVEAIKAAPGLGVKRISLNFAAFRAALERGERIGAGPILRAWRRVLLFMSRWFQIESLYKFNAKFCPEWVPRFMVFPGTRDAVRIGLAALEAEAFLVWPTIELRRIWRKLASPLRSRRRNAVRQSAAVD
ncbi:MAG TPA: phosphatidylglycerol lysyltransferase domain-containing protein [Streptosporangiaceae bacterium]|nr:phosphatidylglycerol lysyltransferase domain-containing protein [Streptosporangiaceae bacterium]